MQIGYKYGKTIAMSENPPQPPEEPRSETNNTESPYTLHEFTYNSDEYHTFPELIHIQGFGPAHLISLKTSAGKDFIKRFVTFADERKQHKQGPSLVEFTAIKDEVEGRVTKGVTIKVNKLALQILDNLSDQDKKHYADALQETFKKIQNNYALMELATDDGLFQNLSVDDPGDVDFSKTTPINLSFPDRSHHEISEFLDLLYPDGYTLEHMPFPKSKPGTKEPSFYGFIIPTPPE